jgi:hypothetical protein
MSFTPRWNEVLASPGSVSGDFEPTYSAVGRQMPKTTGVGTSLLQGQLTCYDLTAKKFKLCPTTLGDQKGGFAICIKDAAEADTTFEGFDEAGNKIDVFARDAIRASAYLKPSTTTAGGFAEWIQGTDSESLKLAKYIGHPLIGEGDGYRLCTDAVAGDLIKLEWIGGA